MKLFHSYALCLESISRIVFHRLELEKEERHWQIDRPKYFGELQE